MKFELITELIGELLEDQIIGLMNDFVQSNPTREEALKVIEACQKGMAIIGRRFENGEYFIGDVIYAGELQEMIIDMLKPFMGQFRLKPLSITLGTVYGGPNNIGEHLFKKIIESAGYEVTS